MSIDAINSLSEAIKVFNNPDTTKDEKRQILAKYPDVVKYVGKDTTQYEISDEDFNLAKDQGKQRAKDSTGHDGSTHSTISTIGSAVGGLAVGAAGTATTMGSNLAANAVGKTLGHATAQNLGQRTLTQKGADKLGSEAVGKGQKNLGDIATVILAAAVEAKYWIEKPNEEQIEAANQLAQNELPEGMDALAETQEIMDETEEESTALAEEAELTNEEANEQIDEDKTKFDFYRAQYNALKSKAESGDKLTSDEKGVMNKLAPQMEQLGTGIGDIQEETSDTVADLNSDLEGCQDIYDESAETMADVEGVTDFAEDFDETTRTLCYVEGASHTLNGIGAGLAAARLWSGGPWMWAFGAIGTAAAISSIKSSADQFKGAAEVSSEIELREQTQDLNTETTDIYDEKLDTYAGQVDMVGDLELEVPDDLEVPVAPTTTDAAEGGDSANPFGVQPTDGQNNGSAGTRGAGEDGNNAGGNTPLENQAGYVNKMGNGSDWSEVMNGNIKRNSDNDIVKDSNGKVVLIKSYSDSITNVTGAKEGEFFSKDSIPQILAQVLGSPFDAKMITDVRNGKKLDSEYTAKIFGTVSGEYKGSKTVDNSEKATAMAKKVIDFYYPIFSQASEKGWVKG